MTWRWKEEGRDDAMSNLREIIFAEALPKPEPATNIFCFSQRLCVAFKGCFSNAQGAGHTNSPR